MKRGALSKVMKAPTGSCFRDRMRPKVIKAHLLWQTGSRWLPRQVYLGIYTAYRVLRCPFGEADDDDVRYKSKEARRSHLFVQHALHCPKERRKCEEAALDCLLGCRDSQLRRLSWSGT